jgi:hypothetical protein
LDRVARDYKYKKIPVINGSAVDDIDSIEKAFFTGSGGLFNPTDSCGTNPDYSFFLKPPSLLSHQYVPKPRPTPYIPEVINCEMAVPADTL